MDFVGKADEHRRTTAAAPGGARTKEEGPHAMPVRAAVLPAILGLSALLAVPALALDIGPDLAAGGLVVQDPAGRVSMASKRLELSPDSIAATYRFVSNTGQPERLRLAFVLPDVGFGEIFSSGRMLDGRDPVNFVESVLSVDGRPMAPSVQQRAIAPDGRDVTDSLRALELPLVGFVDIAQVGPLWHRLEGPGSGPLREQLIRLGLVDARGAIDWTAETVFHWEMIVPADRPVTVEHGYVPFQRRFQFHDLRGWRDALAPWCLTEADWESLHPGGDGARGAARILDYRLSAGTHQIAPIGDFRLILDQGSPEAIVSLCWDGALTRTSPTTLEFRAADWTPTRDLSAVIVHRPGP